MGKTLDLSEILGVKIICNNLECQNAQPFTLDKYQNVTVHRCNCTPLARDESWMQQAARITESIAILKSGIGHSKFRLEFLLSDKP